MHAPTSVFCKVLSNINKVDVRLQAQHSTHLRTSVSEL